MSGKKIKVLFLCSELAAYFTNCIQLVAQKPNCEVLLVHWPLAPSAPFQLRLNEIATLEKKNGGTSIEKICINFNPSLVYLAGWVDKEYMILAKSFKKKGIPVICGIDNPWRGNLRQRLFSSGASFFIRPYCTKMWVPGKRQYEFARKLGFNQQEIMTGLYTADTKKFSLSERTFLSKQLLFVGRLEEIKGVELLYNVFLQLNESERNGWKLRIIGNGPLSAKLKTNDRIEVKNFMQPDELLLESRNAGCFILPSFEEHWGVVVHEFASLGLPLILSTAVNAAEDFLIDQYNGYKFNTGDHDHLKKTLISFFNLSDDEIYLMGSRSAELAKSNSPDLWVARLLSVLPQNES